GTQSPVYGHQKFPDVGADLGEGRVPGALFLARDRDFPRPRKIRGVSTGRPSSGLARVAGGARAFRGAAGFSAAVVGAPPHSRPAPPERGKVSRPPRPSFHQSSPGGRAVKLLILIPAFNEEGA